MTLQDTILFRSDQRKRRGDRANKEFIAQLAKKSGLTKEDARKALDTTLDLIIPNCAKKQKVTFVGFGTFEPRQRKATTKMNPQTRKRINVPAKAVPGFRPGRKFREAVAK